MWLHFKNTRFILLIKYNLPSLMCPKFNFSKFVSTCALIYKPTFLRRQMRPHWLTCHRTCSFISLGHTPTHNIPAASWHARVVVNLQWHCPPALPYNRASVLTGEFCSQSKYLWNTFEKVRVASNANSKHGSVQAGRVWMPMKRYPLLQWLSKLGA